MGRPRRTPLRLCALALILVALLAACGGDAVPGDDADTEVPATEATERERAPAPGSLATDREILVTLYNALDGPNWEDSGNWLSDTPLGEWSGVQIVNGRVTYLQIGGSGSGQELSGEIPLELIGLGALEILNLNDYSGGLRGEIPPEFGNFPNLEYLSLSGSGLTGEIPPELANLANLRDLSIGGNGLTGGIPPELGNLSNLSNLSIEGNGFTGEIPPELGNLSNLYGLYIYSTQLGGAIPPELGNFPHLTELHLVDNELSGEIPPWLGQPLGPDRSEPRRKPAKRGDTSRVGKLLQTGIAEPRRKPAKRGDTFRVGQHRYPGKSDSSRKPAKRGDTLRVG